MARATWRGKVLAQSDSYETVEGNIYFPPGSVDRSALKKSDYRTICSWKGEASYYHVVVDGRTNENAAWYYPKPKEAASQIEDHVAFWRGVEVEV